MMKASSGTKSWSGYLLHLSDEFKVSKAIRIGINLNATDSRNPYDATWVLDAARKVMPQISADTKQFLVRNPYGTDSVTRTCIPNLMWASKFGCDQSIVAT
jgi:hypothetical protein